MVNIIINNFGLGIDSNDTIDEIKKAGHDYIAMPHKSEYQIVLKNDRSTRCDVSVELDGKNIGTWRLRPFQTARVERPSDIARKFTFFREDSSDAKSLGIVSGKSSNGLIKATFKPEKKYIDFATASFGKKKLKSTRSLDSAASLNQMYSNSSIEPDLYKKQNGYSGGATGLGNNSTQKFTSVSPIHDIDRQNVTTIHLRMICCNEHPEYIPLGGRSNTPPPRF